ncbi:MAG: hypothetical protein GX589_08225 [Deltaproteobacteria bacterium]|nr:hypothetical protein [Deltaproteobacteria bacterium]
MNNGSNLPVPTIDEDAYNLFDIPNLTGTAERNLLMAVLERAIRDYVGNCSEEAESAREWLFDLEGTTHDIFSFAWLCHQLDLQPMKVLSKISKMPKRGENRVAPWYFMKAVPA